MSFEVIWDWPALKAFYELHWRTGAVVDAAVIRFAAVRAAKIGPAPLYHLHSGGYDVVLIVDRGARRVTVFRIYRRR